ncbi:MAG: hypothetical protein WBG30_07205 [Psychrilyobacter sp.]|uniref:type IV pilus modification PilV family protein n=1 Tax=Psychrilyobacter sp. TaxID=2586924 RepID=UPI003C766B8C
MFQKKIGEKNRGKKIGYSLIEALVALGILLIGIVPVVTVATKAILFHHRAAETEEAARISQTMIDYIKSRGYDDLSFLGGFTTITPYLFSSTSGGAFTLNKFATDFGIPIEMVLFNSKGINLNDVSLYLDLKTTKGNLKDYNKTNDSYTDPITGGNKINVYREELIYGKIIFGYGKLEDSNLTKRKKEMVTTFIVTPIENWK